jgi:hypothetical protein
LVLTIFKALVDEAESISPLLDDFNKFFNDVKDMDSSYLSFKIMYFLAKHISTVNNGITYNKKILFIIFVKFR